MLNRWFKKVSKGAPKSTFNKNLAHVFSGNLLGGLIYAASIPVIAKLYPVSAFGIFQILLSLSASFSSSSMFRFEKLIILSKAEDSCNTAISLCFVTLFFTVSVFALAFMVAGNQIFSFLDASAAKDYWMLTLTCLFLEGSILIVSEFTLREKMFREYSVYRALSLSLFGLLPVAFSFFSTSFTSLFASRLVGYAICISYLLYKNGLVRKFKWSGSAKIKNMALDNYKFPLYNTPGTVLNTFSLNIPVFLLSRYFGANAVGIYSMANRIVQMPLSVISSAMTNVYFRTAAEKAENGKLPTFFLSTLKKLSIAGLLPVVILPVAPRLASLFLGPQWEQTGVYLQILYPVILASFVSSPLGGTYIIINKQEYVLGLAILAVGARYFSILAFSQTTPQLALASYSIVSFLYYLVYLLILYKLITRINLKAN